MAGEWEKIWFVGGGLPAPWTYAQLQAALSNEIGSDQTTPSVTDTLFGVTHALYRGQRVNLGEPSFSGEGISALARDMAGRVSQPPPNPAHLNGGLQEFCARIVRGKGEITMLSSGSSGEPVAVTHTLPRLTRRVVENSRHRNDIWGLAFSPTHIAGVQVYLQAIANGNTVVNLWGVDRDEVIDRCRRWGVTHLSATPTFYRLLTALDTPLPTIKSVSVGGEVADERLMQHLRRVFPAARLHNVYASTEAGTLLASDGVEFMLREGEAAHLRIEQGRLWIHRSMLGDFVGATEWYDTGDLVEVTATAPTRFKIVGRLRSSVNVGGEKVNPHEVESALTEHPAVLATRVYGRRNSVTGELLAADVVTNGQRPSELELRSHLAQRLPAWKIPRILRFVDRLEVTPSGKVSRADGETVKR
jgi:acyl-CoA synthetase (AMP-forming)/AMP-acid ligase II